MVSSNAVTAWATTCPRESPLWRAYARIARTVLTGSLKVIATVGSDRRQRSAQPGCFLEIAVGLPAGQCELAPEMAGRLGALHLLSEQAVRGVEQARLVGLGGPRHEA